MTINDLRGSRSQLASMVGLLSTSGGSSEKPINLSNSASEEVQQDKQKAQPKEVQSLPQKTPAKDQQQEFGDKSTTHHNDSGTPTPIAHSTPAPLGAIAPPVKVMEVGPLSLHNRFGIPHFRMRRRKARSTT
jgi:hypothetical protein